MNKTITGALALSSVLCAPLAIAQSNVTIYGLLDTAVEHVTNVNANGDSVTKMPSLTGSFPSRIGFRGTEDLGGGLSAIFTLEAGVTMDSGGMSQGNRLFGRQASVGLKGSFGTLTLGRQVNMTYISNLKSDVMGPNLFSIGSIDPYLPNARSDNAIGYYGKFKGLVVGATYSTGRDTSSAGGASGTNCPGEVPGNAKSCRQITGLLGYEVEQFGVNVSYDIMYGGVGAGGGLSSSDDSDKRVTGNLYYQIGAGRLGAGIVDRTTQAATGLTKSDLYFLGVSYPIAARTTLDAQVSRKDVKDSADDATLVVARLSYALSKRTAVYCGIAHLKNAAQSAAALDAGGTVGVGKSQNGVMTGLRLSF